MSESTVTFKAHIFECTHIEKHVEAPFTVTVSYKSEVTAYTKLCPACAAYIVVELQKLEKESPE